jgi:hypothetical protein
MRRCAAGAPLIFIDDFHSTRAPAQRDGSFSKMVLTFRAFPMLDHLMRRRLPNTPFAPDVCSESLLNS